MAYLKGNIIKDLDDLESLEYIKNNPNLPDNFINILIKTRKIECIRYLVNSMAEPNIILSLINELIYDSDIYKTILKKIYTDENVYNTIIQAFIKKFPDKTDEIIDLTKRIYNPKEHIKTVVNSKNNALITYFIMHYGLSVNKYGFEILKFADQSLKSLVFSKISHDTTDDRNRNILYYAIKYGDYETIKIFLIPKLINNIDKEYKTVIHYAYESNDINIVKILLEQNKDILKRDIRELGLLQMAIISECSRDLLELLFQNNYIMTSKQPHYRSWPIHDAIKWISDESKLIWLIDKCDNLNVQDEIGRTPLHYAIQYSNNNIINYILSKNVNVNIKTYDGMYVIHFAFKYNKSIIPELLKTDIKLDVIYDGLLIEHYCVLHNMDIINVNTNHQNRYLFHYIIDNPSHKSLTFCLDNEIDIKKKKNNESVLEYAVHKKINDEYIYKIINLFDKLDILEASIVFNVIRNSREHVGLYLCTKLIDMNIKDCCKKNLLQTSFELNYYELSHYLIDRNINMQSVDNFGDNALSTCLCYCKKQDIITEVIYKTDNINHTNDEKMNCLHIAFFYKHSEKAIRLLLDKGCDIKKLDKYKRKPIDYFKKDKYSEEFVNYVLNDFK